MGMIAAGAALMVGTAANIYGSIKANQAQASAEEANAAFYLEQADYAKKAGERELSIYRDQASEFIGAQKSSFGRAGVELSGSPLLALADTQFRQLKEEKAIQLDTAAKVREATLKSGMAQGNADRLGSFSANFLPAVGQAAVAGASLYGMTRTPGRGA